MVNEERKEKRRGERREKVTVFGDEWREERWKRRHGDGSFFGLILIAGGVLLLLNTLNLLPWKVWDNVWRFWPLLLVLWGLQIIFGENAAGRGLIRLVGLLFVLLIVLFVIYQVNPSALRNLPPVFYQIFDIMKGLQR